MTKYRIYIDEVGNPDLESSDNPNHRFLSLTGVILDLSHVERSVHPQMEAIKAQFFHSHPDDPVIFHRKEMINFRPPFEALKDDIRLKQAFLELWEQGTQYVEPQQFQERFTSKQLKVKTKTNNIAGLQVCDLLAHSSRHEILWENQLTDRPPAAFAVNVIRVLQQKYDQWDGRMLGKKLL